ncbi:protein turtle-like isoform X1, partial [Vespula maculifrons]
SYIDSRRPMFDLKRNDSNGNLIFRLESETMKEIRYDAIDNTHRISMAFKWSRVNSFVRRRKNLSLVSQSHRIRGSFGLHSVQAVLELDNKRPIIRFRFPLSVLRYYGSGGMGGGGGLQATDLRRRLESQSCERNSSENPLSLRQDGFYVPAENGTCEDEDKAEFGAILVSGQPTCTGSRTYKRREKEEDTEERRILRRVIGSDGSFHGKLRFSTKSFNRIENEAEATTEGEGERKQRLRWCRRDFRQIAEVATRTLLLGIVLLVTPGLCHQDAVHITAILGESVVFNCHVEFPGEHPVPYVLQWEKKVGDKMALLLH